MPLTRDNGLTNKETPPKEVVMETNHTIAGGGGHSHHGNHNHGRLIDRTHGDNEMNDGRALMIAGRVLDGTSHNIMVIHLRDGKEQASIKRLATAAMLVIRHLPFLTKHGLPNHRNTYQRVHQSHLLLKHRV